jgi:alpha galactosidase C-like protein/alpha galactosidase A-like protein
LQAAHLCRNLRLSAHNRAAGRSADGALDRRSRRGGAQITLERLEEFMTVPRRRLSSAVVAAAVAIVAMAAAFAMHAGTASAEAAPPAGTTQTPVLGWSSWSFFRHSTDAAVMEAEAKAMQTSGLEADGFQYVNMDDFWYHCPGPQGPNVDQYGRWVTDSSKYPSGPNGENGIAALADYVHSLGLKFGIYVTPGISKQAVAKNTPIEGTPFTADSIATKQRQQNYNCGGMVGINYNKPGAQAFTNSIVNEFASWGVDYIKLDGITNQNVADVKAWSDAIRQSGRPMQLDVTEGSYTQKLGPLLDQYATQWEYSSDIEAYGTTGLTNWDQVKKRFRTLEIWEPTYGGSQYDGYNDFDSVEVGNCNGPISSSLGLSRVSYPTGDGLTVPERQTVLSLWSLAASPIILGTDLTQLCPTDLALITNKSVLAIDQDGIDASMVATAPGERVVAKTLPGGTVAAGLFNTSPATKTITVSASTLGLPSSSGGYQVTDLWSHQTTQVSGNTISEQVPSHGVALLQITGA